MGRSLKQKIEDWIDDIPDSKLDGAYVVGRPIFTDRLCRLDFQGLTSDDPPLFNLQVQVHNTRPDRLFMLNPVAFVLAPIEDPWTPAQIKEALKASVTGYKVMPPRQSKKVDTKDSEDSEDSKDRNKSKRK